MLITHRQGLTALAVGSMPPAFKIHGPNLVGRTGFAARTDEPSLARAPDPPLFHQPHALQDPLETALTGHLLMKPLIDSPKLARAPPGMRVLEPDHLANHCFPKLFGMPLRSTRAFLHPLKSLLVKALQPLVARLGTNPILLAQLPKVARLNRFQHKLFSVVHRFYSLPRHASAIGGPPAKVLPMF